jgi:hypothetical protein
MGETGYRVGIRVGLRTRAVARRKHLAKKRSRSPVTPHCPNEIWSLDFVADQLAASKIPVLCDIGSEFTSHLMDL